MKQVGNLAIVCAQRQDVTMQIKSGQVEVNVHQGCRIIPLVAKWDDDKRIEGFIRELNHGDYAPVQK